MTTIAYKIFKLESMIKKKNSEKYAFFAAVTLSKINFFAYINSIKIQHL